MEIDDLIASWSQKWGREPWRRGPPSRLAELRAMPYPDYLQSAEWQAHRADKLERAGHRCQVCNAEDTQLDVHHRTYERLGQEQEYDLTVLCHRCHSLFHSVGRI